MLLLPGYRPLSLLIRFISYLVSVQSSGGGIKYPAAVMTQVFSCGLAERAIRHGNRRLPAGRNILTAIDEASRNCSGALTCYPGIGMPSCEGNPTLKVILRADVWKSDQGISRELDGTLTCT